MTHTPFGFFFNSEDFKRAAPHIKQICADVANAKLNKALGPVVYCSPATDARPYSFEHWHYGKNSYDNTHIAHLFNVQEINKEPCKHEPISTREGVIDIENKRDYTKIFYTPECKHCGAKLKAKWEEEI